MRKSTWPQARLNDDNGKFYGSGRSVELKFYALGRRRLVSTFVDKDKGQ